MAMFTNLCPGLGDTASVLLKKINEFYSLQNANAHPPKPLDWRYNSLWKIAAILAGCS